jgi:hypothetical protein
MSNFHPTVGRNVQYVNERGVKVAGIIVQVNLDSVDLQLFTPEGGLNYVKDVKPFMDTFDARRRSQPHTYLLHWSNR